MVGNRLWMGGGDWGGAVEFAQVTQFWLFVDWMGCREVGCGLKIYHRILSFVCGVCTDCLLQ